MGLCLLHIKLCILFRKTKPGLTQLFCKNLFCQARGSNTKADSQNIGRGVSLAWGKQTHFCPDTCSPKDGMRGVVFLLASAT